MFENSKKSKIWNLQPDITTSNNHSKIEKKINENLTQTNISPKKKEKLLLFMAKKQTLCYIYFKVQNCLHVRHIVSKKNTDFVYLSEKK